MKYVKKSEYVEAWQWAICGSIFRAPDWVLEYLKEQQAMIRNSGLEIWVNYENGLSIRNTDWFVKFSDGRVSILKDEYFRTNYLQVDE